MPESKSVVWEQETELVGGARALTPFREACARSGCPKPHPHEQVRSAGQAAWEGAQSCSPRINILH